MIRVRVDEKISTSVQGEAGFLYLLEPFFRLKRLENGLVFPGKTSELRQKVEDSRQVCLCLNQINQDPKEKYCLFYP